MSTKKGTKPAWYGLAAVALGTGVFFLATNKGRLLKKGTDSLKGLLGGAAPAAEPLAAEPVEVAGGSSTSGRTPTPENGHVRDVDASNPPKPDSGSNFTPESDFENPKA